jgi:hypothetical protein
VYAKVRTSALTCDDVLQRTTPDPPRTIF